MKMECTYTVTLIANKIRFEQKMKTEIKSNFRCVAVDNFYANVFRRNIFQVNSYHIFHV